jgi:alpha-1,3-glucosyltransferase
VDNLDYASSQTIIFQRLSVVLTDLFFIWAVYRCLASVRPLTSSFSASAQSQTSKGFSKIVFLSLVFSPAFLFLDHIHFQYNSPLFSLLVFSLLEAPTRPLLSAFLFASLLCFKHIFLYIAPAYFFYLLRTYCLSPCWRPQLVNIVKLGVVVLAPMGQIQVVAERLFPFQRGLCHAYWAPNFWALYSFLDRVAIHRKPGSFSKLISSGTYTWIGD